MKKHLIRAAFSMVMLTVLTTSAYAQWVQTNWSETTDFFDLYTSEGRVLARIWDSLNGGRTFVTTNDGANWNLVASAEGDIDILSLVTQDGSILAGAWDGLYQPAVNGDNWTWQAVAAAGIPADAPIMSLAAIGDFLYAGGIGAIYQSAPGDPDTWTELVAGLPEDARITCMATNGLVIVAGTNSDGVFVAVDGGASWAPVNSGLGDQHIRHLAVMGTTLFAVTSKGVYASDIADVSWMSDIGGGTLVSDAGGTMWLVTDGSAWVSDPSGLGWTFDPNLTVWSADRFGLENVDCLLVVDDLLYAGTDGNGVHISTDQGQTWTPASTGLPAETRVWSLTAGSDGLSVFAGTDSGIWRIAPDDISSYTIAATAAEGGTISPSGDITVYRSGSQTFTIAVELGYKIADVLVDGVSVGTLASYTFSQVAADHTISVAFESIPIRTLTASAEEGGAISPAGTILVSDGASQTFTITTLPGNAISAVIVDGTSVGAVSSYTFENITQDHTISVTFEDAPYIITASAETGGSISPAGEVEVWEGASQTFTIASADGYAIGDVLVDGVSVGAVDSYTFSEVADNHTISATFNSLAVYRINCGGAATGLFTADQYYSDGRTYSTGDPIDMTDVNDPAPQDVYQTERYGTMVYTFPDLNPGMAYIVRLHFAEIFQTSVGSRVFDVFINDMAVLPSYDLYAELGADDKAVVKEFTAMPDDLGQITIMFITLVDNAKIGGIEILQK